MFFRIYSTFHPMANAPKKNKDTDQESTGMPVPAPRAAAPKESTMIKLRLLQNRADGKGGVHLAGTEIEMPRELALRKLKNTKGVFERLS